MKKEIKPGKFVTWQSGPNTHRGFVYQSFRPYNTLLCYRVKETEPDRDREWMLKPNQVLTIDGEKR